MKYIACNVGNYKSRYLCMCFVYVCVTNSEIISLLLYLNNLAYLVVSDMVVVSHLCYTSKLVEVNL